MHYPNLNSILFAIRKVQWRRVVSFVLALLLFTTTAPFPAFSVESEQEQGSGSSSTPNSGELIYDYDMLKITRKGEQISRLDLLSHEKIEIEADGLTEDADYQWQVQHPEKDDVWVHIYDGTNQTISVTLALVENVLREDGTAMLRCQATAGDYIYLSSPVTVTVLQEDAANYSVMPLADDDTSDGDTGEETTEETETPEFVTITIEYWRYDYVKNPDTGKYELSDTPTPAFSSYIATIVYGASFSATVTVPTIVGYKAHLGDNVGAITQVTLDYNALKENQTITVNYKPAEVNYTVRYYFQNIYDDNYVEDTAIMSAAGITEYPMTGSGETGSAPEEGDIKKEFSGFTSMFYQPDTVAADGSTVFEVYYERNYYLMDFDCDGGYGADPVYVRYGTYISIPTPKKSGWTFEYWDLTGTYTTDEDEKAVGDGQADALPATMPAYNSHYKAIWKQANTTYTVAYWILDSKGNKTYIGSRTVNATSGTTVDGTHDLGTEENGGVAKCGLEAHTHDAGCYQDIRNMETVDSFTFENDEGEAVTIETDKNVTVEGDGSTVVNVYYQYEEYTLKFYYAATTGGTDTDSDGVIDKYDSIKIVGGTTYYFGRNGINTSDDEALLENEYFTYSGQWGSVSALPTLNEEGVKRNYTIGSVTYSYNGTDVTYHYISFKARYNDNISDMWPCGVFNSATRTTKNSSSTWSGTEAFVSAWNGEHHVKYSGNPNQTIKGVYEKLDDNLLFDSTYDDETEVSYLCFWENGADIGWSIPELYRYKIWLEGDAPNNETTVTRDSKTFYLADVYDTCDNSSVGQQTQPGLTGYTPYYVSNRLDGYSYENNFESVSLTGTTDAEQLKQDGYFDSSLYAEGFEVNFYYLASGHILNFKNYNEWLADGNGVEVSYGTPLQKYGDNVNSEYMKARYPEGLEPGAYEFVGWYTTELCLPGTEVDWATATMPDSDLLVYAYWKPVEHNVYFYSLYTDVGTGNYWTPTDANGNAVNVSYPIVVQHGDLLGTTYSYIPAREGYRFVGWFYMDENGKKRFAPDSMEIKRELHLFAEWQSDIDTTYAVTYVLKESVTIDDTTYPAGTAIAAVTEGHSTAGKTKTFSAKGGTDLYLAFREGYFPETGSHSILMQEDSTKNVYTFTYIYDDNVEYKIRYVDYETKLEIATTVTKITNDAVVTEKFLPVSGYIPMPGYYYQTKALVSDGKGEAQAFREENTITFYYMKDADHGAYSIEYYTQNLDGTFSQVTSIQNTADLKDSAGNPNVINSGDEFEILTFDGYTYTQAEIINYNNDGTAKPTVSTKDTPISGELDANGLTIKLYYNRISYAYEIQFLEYGTGNVLGFGKVDDETLYNTDPKASAMFGEEISYTAPANFTIGNTVYEYYVSDATAQQRTDSMTIRAATESSNPNILKFYYTPKQYTVHYVAVCTNPNLTNFGTVSIANERVTTAEHLSGSTATPYTGYQFEGWYSDAACSGEPLSTAETYKPEVIADENDECTFYALFRPITTSLTIKKTGENISPTSNFLFSIVGQDNNNKHINLIVSISGSGSITVKDLPIGEYVITELTGWSWEHKFDSISGTFESGGSCTVNGSSATYVAAIDDGDGTDENVITFTNSYANPDWLGGEDSKENTFTGVATA